MSATSIKPSDLEPLTTPLSQSIHSSDPDHPAEFLLSTCLEAATSTLVISLALLSNDGDDSKATYWGRKMEFLELSKWVEVKGAAVRPDRMIGRLKDAMLEAALALEGYAPTLDGASRRPIELQFLITPTLRLPILLPPTDKSLVSLLFLIRASIPNARSSTQLVSLQFSHEKLEKEMRRTRNDLDRKTEEVKRIKRTGTSGSGREEHKTKPDAPVIPGVTHRATLRPGMAGYAGNPRKLGVVKKGDNDGFDEDPPTDDD